MSVVTFFFEDGEEIGVEIEDIAPPAVGTVVDLDIEEGLQSAHVVKMVHLGVRGKWDTRARSDEWRQSSWYEVYLSREIAK